jgi:hypothetical protein
MTTVEKLTPYPRPASLRLEGWEGSREQLVYVIAETTAHYRITPTPGSRVKLAGRDRWLSVGESTLVPRSAVDFGHPMP